MFFGPRAADVAAARAMPGAIWMALCAAAAVPACESWRCRGGGGGAARTPAARSSCQELCTRGEMPARSLLPDPAWPEGWDLGQAPTWAGLRAVWRGVVCGRDLRPRLRAGGESQG